MTLPVPERDRARLGAFYGQMTSLGAVLAGAAANGLDVERLTAADLYTRGLDCHNLGGHPELEAVAEAVERFARPGPDDAVLDVGCGLGGPSRFLADRYGCVVSGVDLVRERVEVATRLAHLTNSSDRVAYRVADATALPFRERRFAQAWMLDVSIHIRDKRPLFDELARVLQPGGLLAVHEQIGPLPRTMHAAKRQAPYFSPSLPLFIRLLEQAGLRLLHWEDTTALVLAEFHARRDLISTIDLTSLTGASAVAARKGRRLLEAYLATLEGPAGRTGVLVAAAPAP